MNVQAEKYKLIEWITSLEDISVLKLLKSIQQKNTMIHPEFSQEEKQLILQFLEQSESDILKGNVYPHNQVMKEVRERYGIKK